MNTEPWEKTCKRCGRSFEVGLWCREVTYCDTCKAELDAVHTDSFDHKLPKQQSRPEVSTPNGYCPARGHRPQYPRGKARKRL